MCLTLDHLTLAALLAIVFLTSADSCSILALLPMTVSLPMSMFRYFIANYTMLPSKWHNASLYTILMSTLGED